MSTPTPGAALRKNTARKRIQRILNKREPQLVEHTKTALVLRGGKTSAEIVSVLRDIYRMKKPDAVMFSKHNHILPFEDDTSLEFFSNKNDAAFFVFGSHSKKRPHNLVIGRFFNYHILDMIEFGVENYVPMDAFPGAKSASGSKPCFIFTGPDFEVKQELRTSMNLLVDLFRGTVVDKVNLEGLDHVIICTAVDGKILFRQYLIRLKKTGTRLPYTELEEMGPHMDLTIRRTKFAASDLEKEALRQPPQLSATKRKNISTTPLGETLGRIHMTRQDLNRMATRKFPGLHSGRDKYTSDAQPASKKAKHESVSAEEDAE
jgi:ribosome production factor 2